MKIFLMLLFCVSCMALYAQPENRFKRQFERSLHPSGKELYEQLNEDYKERAFTLSKEVENPNQAVYYAYKEYLEERSAPERMPETFEPPREPIIPPTPFDAVPQEPLSPAIYPFIETPDRQTNPPQGGRRP